MVYLVLCNTLLPVIVKASYLISGLSKERCFLEEFSPLHMALFYSCAVGGTYLGANLIIMTYGEQEYFDFDSTARRLWSSVTISYFFTIAIKTDWFA